MNKSAYLNSTLATFFALMMWFSVTHAYEHDNEHHVSEDCEICFILVHSADDGWVDSNDQCDPVIYRYQLSFSCKTLFSSALTHNQARAPPV